MKDARADILDIKNTLNGVHDRSVRQRLHKLENDNAAAKAAEAALVAARAMQGQTWTKRERVGLFLFAGFGAFGTVVSVAVLLTTGGGQ